jgi:large subunit ribosomal protein L9
MAQTEVLLLQPLPNLGGEGEKVRVRSGYARNYLLPRKLAIPATRANVRQVEALEARRLQREQAEKASAEELASRVEAVRPVVVVKTGEGGKMFGAVTVRDLLDKLEEAGVELDRKRVHLPAPVKTLGEHEAKVRLHPEVERALRFEVVSENPIESAPDEGAEEAAVEA